MKNRFSARSAEVCSCIIFTVGRPGLAIAWSDHDILWPRDSSLAEIAEVLTLPFFIRFPPINWSAFRAAAATNKPASPAFWRYGFLNGAGWRGMMQIPDAILKQMVERLGYDWTHFRTQRLLCPHYIARLIELHQSNVRLAHYTATETALKIAEGRAIWLRNVRCMNDFSEVQWGARLFERFFDSDEASPFWDTLDSIHSGIRAETTRLYRGWAQDFVQNTYVFCVSEHRPEIDTLGRLSMWRAYAQSNGCAVVLNTRPFYQVTDALSSYSYPVCYLSENAAQEMFRSIVHNVIDNKDFLNSLSRKDLVGNVFKMMEYHATCMKHPAFEEEREWRVIHRPLQNPNPRMKSEIMSVRGVVQKVFLLPLKNVPEEELLGIEPHEIVDELLLGPSIDSAIAKDAAVEKLGHLGFSDPANTVRETHIPLRA